MQILCLVNEDTIEMSNSSYMCFKQSYRCSTFKSGTGRNLCYIIIHSLYFNILMNYPYISPKLFASLTDTSPIITH